MTHPAVLVFLRQVGRLLKGVGTACEELALALERAKTVEQDMEKK